MLRLVIVWLAIASCAAAQERSPFTNVRFEQERIGVEVDGAWYVLEAIDGVGVRAIVEGAKRVDDGRWRKRVAEDLVAVLAECGHEAGARVTLVLIDDAGERVELRNVEMTGEKRRLVYSSWQFDVSVAFADLARVIEREHAYAAWRGIDLAGAAHDAAARSDSRDAALLEAQKLVCRLGDGHASMRGWRDAAPDGRLGFALWEVEGGVMALRDEGEPRLLAEGFPFVVSIDGVGIDDWTMAASAFVTDGSAALVRRRSHLTMQFVNLVRDELGLERSAHVEVLLRNDQGETRRMGMPLATGFVEPPFWPAADAGVRDQGYDVKRLAGDVGYVRLLEMMGDASPVREAIEGMLDAPGIIIDVRSNGGGSRSAVVELLPLFMKEEARVVNLAKRRVHEGDIEPEGGWLADRFMRPVDWNGWTDAERAALDEVMAGFEPVWAPAPEGFSDWQAMVVSRGDVSYDGPVVVLMDSWCFSATDIFLGAFKGVEGVTLIGEASSGGSAYSAWFDVEGLGRVKLARMASYRPDGRMYDGMGIAPDVEMTPTVGDVLGEGDSFLQAAIGSLLRAP